MAKNLNVSLAFTANASQAKAELNALKKSLNELVSGTALKTPDFKFTKDIQDAARAAAQLKVQLDSAINVKTGNLDLTKFSESMTKSGMSLEKYQNQLYQLGPAGEKAFADLTRAITMADVPLKRSGKLLNELWTTMKNTARWQLTSSAMHGFMGAVQSAYGYAKDLNSSLNEIRIVTGASTDKMAEFAKEANSAAKALSTTTTDYTNASLIFYQQGLADSQVKERTDITIKMANAAGASAEKVSDQLTAVWNNFYDGSKSLEYYADVMTALGAATASSTDEISEGLQKFAAVADTVGLSYEYATAALATITSNTRQSADVVGNALKTLFARIQGLQLGETLEDGTDLNKYSEALDKVGISIYDQNGQLKNMDKILSEMASKWENLSGTQQVALAQTVAGVRQYTQLIALMDNWDNGDNDSMMANLQTANNATGALQEQADIYADSWEASSKRVKASLEAVYSALLKDDFFIDLNNLFADLVDGVKIFIDSLGGVEGVLLTIGGLVTNIFSKQIAQSIQNAAFSIKGLFNPKAILDQEMAQKKKINELLVSGLKDQGTTSSGYSAEAYKALGENQLSYIQNAERMSEEEQSINQILMDRNRLLVDNAIQEGKELEQIENKIEAERRGLTIKASRAGGTGEQIKEVARLAKEYENLKKSASGFQIIANTANKNTGLEKDAKAAAALKKELSQTAQEMLGLKNIEKLNKPDGVKALTKAFQDLNEDIDLTTIDLDTLWKILNNDESVDLEKIVTIFDNIAVAVDKAGNKIENAKDKTGTLRAAMVACGMSTKEIEAAMDEYNATLAQYEDKVEGAEAALKKVIAAMQNHNAEMDKTKTKSISYAEAFSIAASAVMTLTQALTTIKGIIDVFNDENATKEDFVWALISGLGMLTISISSLLPQLTKLAGLFGTTGASAAGATPAVAGFGVALNTALGTIGWVALALTALVGVVAIVISTMDTATEKAKKHFEQMSKEAEKSVETLDEAKNAYENLNDTITAYTDARNSINNLTEGTVEFKNAILEANEAARTLIELYGVASKYNAETGLIEINEKDWKEKQTEYQEKLENARINNVAAQSNKIFAQNRLKNAKIAEKDDTDYWKNIGSMLAEGMAMGGTVGAAIGAKVGTGAGTVLGAGVGAIPGMGIGAGIGGIAGMGVGAGAALIQGLLDEFRENQTNEEQIAALENLQDAYDQNGKNLETAMSKLSDSDKALIDSLGLTSNELDALCTEVSTNTAAILQNNKQIIDDNFKDNAVYENSKYKDELNTLMADELKDKTEQIYNDTYSQSKMSDKKAQQAYAEMMNYTWVKNAGNNNGVYSKGDGSQNFTISDETARQALAQRDAIEALNGSLVEYNNTLQRIAKTGQSFDTDVSDLLLRLAGGAGASFGDASGSEITALENKINADGFKAIDLISDTDAQNMGYDDAKAYVDSLRAAIKSYRDRLTNIGKNLATSITQGFLGIEDLSADGAESMARNLTEAFTTSGKETANLLDEIFVEAGDHADELSSILEDVDWGDPNAVAKLNAKIKEQGLKVNTTSEAWINYVNAMSQAGIAIGGINNKFETLRTTLSTVKEVINNLSSNNIIADDTYEELMAINPLIKDLFIITEDGYRFIGSQEDLSTLLTGNIKEKFKDVREQFNGIRSDMEQVNRTNWFNEDGSQAYSDDQNLAAIASYASDDTPLDSALSYMGISKDSLREAADYLQKYADDETKNTDPAFDQTKYDEYLAYVQNFYDQLGQMQSTYASGGFEDNIAEELNASQATTISELNALVESGAISGADKDSSSLNAYEKQLQALTVAGMQSAGTIKDLWAVIREAEANGATIDYNQYASDIERLGSQYSNAADEIRAYQAALNAKDEELIKSTQFELETAIAIGESAEAYGIEAGAIEDVADGFLALAKSGEEKYKILAEDAEALQDAAVRHIRFNEALNDLSQNSDDYVDVLKDIKSSTDDVSKAMKANTPNAKKLRSALAGLLGTSEDLVDVKLLDAIDPDDFEKAADGDVDAIERIRDAFIKMQIEGVENVDFDGIKSELSELEEGAVFTIDADPMPMLYKLIQAKVNAGADAAEIQSLLSGFNIDADVTGFEQAMTKAQAMAAQASGAIIADTSFSQEVETVTADTPVQHEELEYDVSYTSAPVTANSEILATGDSENTKNVTETRQNWTKRVTPNVVPSETTEQSTGTSVKTTNGAGKTANVKGVEIKNAHRSSGGAKSTGGSSGKSGGGGGGGGSKPKTADHKKKSDVVDRYKEITDSLNDNTKALENATKASDGLYGKARIKNMEKVNELLQKEIKLLARKRKEALEYLEQDRSELEKAASEAGINFTFDADGDITNYTEQMTKLYDQYNAAVDAANADGNVTEEEQKALDKLEEKINNTREAIEQYDETKELLYELDQQEIDKFNEQLSNNLEKFTIQLELDLEFNEKDLEFLEYYLSKVEDDVYSQAEAATLSNQKLDIYLDNLKIAQEAYDELNRMYEAGEISSADYAEQMKELSSTILENLENIEQLDSAMKDYYGNTISMAQDEIAKFTDLMENAAGVLEHYKSLMDLFGRSTDYEGMSIILEAQAEVAQDAYETSKSSYDMFKKQAEDRKAAYDAAVAAGVTGYELEVLEQQWLDAENAAAEAQEQMLADAEAWAESMRAILENSLAKFADELEDALTGEFGSFNELTTQLERASSLQEEFLTTTNKIYETNKLMRTAQKELDKTTNESAKRKLKAFITETNELQQQGKLSQYELEIQQAKYDLLLAEIALKEAQNAKSTVRLQRDSEGNFGYVYTADQSAIDDAQQKFEDAQNNMYNKGLEGANNYAEKYIQTMSEMNDTMAEIQQKYYDGEYESEAEYEAAMSRAKEYYYQQLQNYSHLYQVSLTTDSRVAADAWTKDFGDMTTQTETWMTNVDSYMSNVRGAFSLWNTQMSGLEGQTIGKSLDELATKTSNITTKSEELKNKLLGDNGVIAALGLELSAVTSITTAYINQRAAMDDVIDGYELLAESAKENAENTANNEFDISPGSQVTVKSSASTWLTGEGMENYGSLKSGEGYTVLRWDTNKEHILISNGAGSYGWVNKTDLVGFDTGGYTGEWGPYGKMAMVHEKELILNPHDTDNLLASIEFLSKILEIIDLQSMNSQFGGWLSSPGVDNNPNVIEQSVHIEASFPNAVNHTEIEAAFNNLINASSQYANRK